MLRDKLIAAALVTALLLTGCGSDKAVKTGKAYLYTGDSKKKEESEFETCKVKKTNFVNEITESATLEYTKEDSITMDIGNATLETIEIKEGEKVKKGQVVATFTVDIDEADMERQKLELEQQRKQFNAELKMKKNALDEAKRMLDAMKKGNEKSIREIEYQKQKKEFDQFKASEKGIKAKEKEYASLIADSKKTKLVSKISGMVTKMGDAQEGEPIEAGTVIATLQTSSDFIIKAENSTGDLRYNMAVDVWLGGDRNDIRYKLKGTIVSSDNLTSTGGSSDNNEGMPMDSDNDSGSDGAYVKISKADKKKYNFEENNVYIHYETKRIENALVADNEAVYSELDGEETKSYVYVVDNGNLHKRYVVANFSNDKVTQIEQGVEEGWVLAKDVVDDEEVGTKGSSGGSDEDED